MTHWGRRFPGRFSSVPPLVCQLIVLGFLPDDKYSDQAREGATRQRERRPGVSQVKADARQDETTNGNREPGE